MKPLPLLLSAFAALVLALASPMSMAERTPPRSATLQPTTGEVIVGFKSGASVTRMHALAARSDAATAGSVLAQRAATLGARVGRALEAGAAVSERVQVMRASGVDAATLAAQLAADPDVEFAVPNGRKRRLVAPNDPLYPAGGPPPANTTTQTGGPDVGQWYLRAPDAIVASSIDIESAWLQTTGSASVVVADIDTGVRRDHPDLVGANLLQGYDFISDAINANDGDGRDADPSDPGDWISAADVGPGSHLAALGCTSADISNSSWHGTTTTSLIGAATNNGIGMAGAAPGVSVLPLRVLGKCGGSDADILAAMQWAVGIDVPGVSHNNNPARVLNMSLGATGACDSAYQSVVNQVLAKGAVIVVAAGNSAGRAVGTPANCAGVIGVAGLRHVGTKVGFSDLGPQIALAAPAGNCVNITAGSVCLYPILAATNTGTQGPAASAYTDSFDPSLGTSFSAPLVAATAALMFSAQPALTPAGVRAALQTSARAFPSSGVADDPTAGPIVACQPPTNSDQLQCYCTSTTCGAGMLDAGAAVRASLGAQVVIGVSPAAPQAGQTITLSGKNSTVASGRSITGWQWSVVDAGSTASVFSGATTADSATLQSTAAGTVIVRLAITDNLGVAVAAQQSIAVAAAPATASGGSGGGAMSWAWLAALALAAALLALWRPARMPR
jgi:serine protease